ncbi:papilin-like isoform X2 [Dreissena polymorpha]|uniref:papilin-like isoform X2 n=1 Tax=Dreissena polymorpha TaxID=45954 RepID=UPI0022653185|nr:papilin-like isoform X2 [Dreissena polymorpha]
MTSRDRVSLSAVCLLLSYSIGVFGRWSEWGEYSGCSRTCGGGVKFKTRHCEGHGLLRDACEGRNKHFEICNTQSCGEYAQDFRASQCDEYNFQPLEGKLYKWTPYYGHGETCKLLCQADGFSFYHKLAEQVVDGTMCGEETTRICVQGRCKNVGCDNKIGSYKKLDDCAVCGGNNSACAPTADVTGVFYPSQLSRGYTPIVEVPEGSENIYIQENGENKNSIVFWDSLGNSFAVDKKTRMLLPRVELAGTMFVYSPNDAGNTHGRIEATGPTSHTITIYALNEGAQNPSLQYGYTPPISDSNDLQHRGSATYEHKTKKSNDGLNDALSGIKKPSDIQISASSVPNRNFGITNVRIVDRRGTSSLRDINATFSEDSLEDIQDGPRFVYGNGIQVFGGSKSVRQNVHQTKHTLLEAKEKGHHLEEIRYWPENAERNHMPLQSQTLVRSLVGDERFMWSHGMWTECIPHCGAGTQQRVVSCIDREKREVTDPRSCDQNTRPVSVQRCNNGNCDERGSHLRWQMGRWSECSATCDLGDQVQDVFCERVLVDNSTRMVDDEECLSEFRAKPQYQRSCNDDILCSVWAPMEWGQCSVTCGDGVQYREVKCTAEGDLSHTLPAELCSTLAKPDNARRCQLTPCQVVSGNYRTANRSRPEAEVQGRIKVVYNDGDRYVWTHGDWSDCDPQCGDGIQRRAVSCIDRESREISSPGFCDRRSQPVSVQRCNSGDCRLNPADSFVRWQVGRWSECSQSCDLGEQTQDVFCESVLHNNTTRVVDDVECLKVFSMRPEYQRSCNEDVPCPMWRHSKWGECSVTCGEGIQTRLLSCVPSQRQSRPFPHSMCNPNLRPVSRQRCTMLPCNNSPHNQRLTPRPTGSSNHNVRISTGSGDGIVQYAGGRVVLPCITLSEEDLARDYEVEWRRDGLNNPILVKFSGRPGQPTDGYKGRASLIGHTSLELYPVYISDTGRYTCTLKVIPRHQGHSRKYTVETMMRVAATSIGDNIVITEDDSTTTATNKVHTNYDSQGICRLNPDQGYSRSNLAVKWYYHHGNNTCYRFWYEGLGGNGNRFENETICLQTCYRRQNTEEETCSMPPMTGRDCKARMSRYYYDKSRGECLQFIYGGCGGNNNNFQSKADCERECRAGSSALGDQEQDCRTSRYGCCSDGVTKARGDNQLGCPHPCKDSEFGCCPDGVTPAQGTDEDGCEDIDIVSGAGSLCDTLANGCCPDGVTPAKGPYNAGCDDDGKGVIMTTAMMSLCHAMMSRCQLYVDNPRTRDHVAMT